MPPQVIFSLRYLHASHGKVLVNSGAGDGSGGGERISRGTIVRLVLALAVFVLVIVVVTCVAWPRHRGMPSAARIPQARRGGATHLASVPAAHTQGNVRRQPSVYILPPPPYVPAPSYASLPLVPAFDDEQSDVTDDPSVESISMAGIEVSSPSLAPQRRPSAARISAPLDMGAELQLPPQAHGVGGDTG